MENNRFFIWLWRLNAVLIFAVGIGLLAVMALAVRDYASRLAFGGQAGPRAVAPDRQPTGPAGPPPPLRLVLDGLAPHGTSDRLYGAVRSVEGEDRDGVSYKKSGGPIRNLIAVDLASLTHRPVFATSGQVVVTYDVAVRADAPPSAPSSVSPGFFRSPTGPAVGLVISVITRDRDGDGDLDTRDGVALLVTGPDGQGATSLAEGLADVKVTAKRDDGTVIALVTGQPDQAMRLLHIDVAGRRLLADTAISIPPIRP